MTAAPSRGRHRPVATLLAVVAAAVAGLGPAAPAVAQLTPPAEPVVGWPAASTWPEAPELDVPVHLLVDAATGQVLSAERADEHRPVASTVKMLTALTVVDHLEGDDLTERVEIGSEVVGLEGTSVALDPGERWSYEQLLGGLLVRSGNDAAVALATAVAGDEAAFVARMRDTAAHLGLRTGAGMRLTSASGLDDEQHLSAHELATVGRALLDHPTLAGIVAVPELTLPDIGTAENRNLLVGDYPGATGIKTGYTEAAGNSLVASAERDGRELVAVVLGAGPDPERFRDAARLLDHGFERFADRELAGDRTFLVAGGSVTLTVDPVELVAPVVADVTLELPLPVRVDELETAQVPIAFDAEPVATAPARVDRDRTPAPSAAARIGRALADGTYAALRAAHAAGHDPAAGEAG